jgi:hypothetical protein
MALVLAAAVAGVACTEEEVARTDQQVREVGDEARQEAREAWAGIRTDGERLIDEIQTRNDPEAKQDLLNACRDALERLRKADAAIADRVQNLCDRIRDADVNTDEAWNDVKRRFQEINREFS